MHIYRFHPYLKSVIWGGSRLAPYKHIDTDQANIGESWELSGVPGHESKVNGGPDDGLTLPELIDRHGAALVGESVYKRFGRDFPLLIKFIDAEQNLSVQVHPDEALAQQRHGCHGKTEMWYLIESRPGARIYSGLSREVSPDQFAAAIADNTVMDLIAANDARPGDLFFLPAGRIHAIGAGNMLVEIQQSSDITYRIYDYDRRDADGRPRQLHVQEALGAIDYDVLPDYTTHYDEADPACALVRCEYFDVRRYRVDGEAELKNADGSCIIAICLDGECEITTEAHGTETLSRGQTVLIPAAAKEVKAVGRGTLITATIP